MPSDSGPAASPRPGGSRPDSHALLAVYLNDHLAGATGGRELARRMARAHHGDAAGEPLARIAREVTADRAALLSLMADLGVRPRRYKVAAGWLGERLGRVKPNQAVLRRSPLSSLLEIEGLYLGVRGKAALWRSLRAAADELGLDRDRLNTLLDRAEEQAATLEELRLTEARHLAHDRD